MMEPCCARDTDLDGNCDIHVSKGVLRHTPEPERLNFGPNDVDLSNGLCSTFGKGEVESAAEHLIEYLQEKGENKWWFTFGGLYLYYYNNNLNSDEMLFGLLGPWFDDGGMMHFREDGFYIVNWGSGLQVTEEFLKRIKRHVR